MKKTMKGYPLNGWLNRSFMITLAFLLVGGAFPVFGTHVAKAEPMPLETIQVVAGTGVSGSVKTDQAAFSQLAAPTDIEVIGASPQIDSHLILFNDLGNEESWAASGNGLPFAVPGVGYVTLRFKDINNRSIKAVDFAYRKNSNTNLGINQLYFTGYAEGSADLNVFRTTGNATYDAATRSFTYQVNTLLAPNSFEQSGGLAVTVTGNVYGYDNLKDEGFKIDPSSSTSLPLTSEPVDYMSSFLYPRSVDDIAVNGDTMYVLSNQGYINMIDMNTGGGEVVFLNVKSLDNLYINNPTALAVDANGQIYLADTGNDRVVRIVLPPAPQSPNDYSIYPVAGTGVKGKSAEGEYAILAELNAPQGVAVANDGTVYISDTGNHRVLQLSYPQEAVASVKAQAGDASADVSWDAADGALYYEVYRYAGTAAPSDPENWEYAGSTWNGSSTPNSATTNLKVTGLSNGQSYVFGVKAKSLRSTSKFTVSDPVKPVGAVTAPEKPANVSATAGNASAAITWNPSDGATSYIVYCFQGENAPDDSSLWTEVAKDVTGTSYTATGLQNGKPYLFAVKAVGPGGVSSLSQNSKAVIPVASTTNPPSTGGSTSTPVTTTPTPVSNTTTLNVNVQNAAGANGDVVASLAITRTTGADGVVKDALQLTPAKAAEIVNLLKASGSKTAAILLPDAADLVSQWDVAVPNAASKLLTDEGIELVILNPNARITVPTSSLAGLADDLYFRLIPVKSTATSAEIQARALANPEIVAQANGGNITVVGRPMTIETNLQSRPVTLVLPLPTGQTFTAAEQKKLGVYIEHSDGSKQLIRGKVVSPENGKWGLEITVDRFSTFTVVNVSNWGSTLIASPYILGYVDGSFRPAQNITRAELAAIVGRITGVTEGTATFSDVKSGSWAAEVVGPAAASGVMTGYSDGTFKPNAPITRGELAAALAKLLPQSGLDASQAATGFSDLPAGNWAATAAAELQAAGVVTGYADGSFKPERNVTRAEAVTMINRLVGLDGSTALPGAAAWSDVADAYWASEAIRAASMQR